MIRELKRINKEYEDFRKEVLLLSKKEIFNMAYKINFYHEIWSFINDTGRKIKSKMIIITFGKYKGQSLIDIFHNDRSYIKYLRDKSKDIEIVEECKRLLAN